MKSIYILTLLLMLYSCSRYPQNVRIALKLAGDNRSEIEKVITHYKQDNNKLKLQAAYDLIGALPGKFHYDNPESDAIILEFCDSLQAYKQQYTKMNRPYTIIYSKFIKQHPGLFRQSNPIPDIAVISSDMLIENIDMAFYVWKNMPWAKNLSYDNFRDYILPYKTGFMKPEPWRKNLFEEFKWVLDSINDINDPVEACILVNDNIKSRFTSSIKIQPKSISLINELYAGDCRTASTLATYAMRAIGIPVKIASTLITGNPPFNGSHYENIVLSKDLKMVRFEGSLNSPIEVQGGSGYKGKWFIEMDHVNRNWITEKVSDKYQIPPSLQNNKLVDITQNFPDAFTVKLETQFAGSAKSNRNAFVYLCVSTRRGGWSAIDFTPFNKDSIIFRNINPGVYFPMIYKNGQYNQCANPFKLFANGNTKPILKSTTTDDSSQSIKLYRKYPMNNSTVVRSGSLIGDVFEVANNPYFTNPTTIHTIRDSTFHITDVNIRDTEKYKYIRYKMNTYEHKTKLADLKFYGKGLSAEQELLGNIIYPEAYDSTILIQIDFATNKDYFNGFNLKNYLNDMNLDPQSADFSDLWFGYELGSPTQITKIRYMCRSDVNCVIPGHTYQLDYLEDATWIPIEQKVADNVFVEFDNVPKNKLYLLRNLTEGQEEYFFTYENGVQIWW